MKTLLTILLITGACFTSGAQERLIVHSLANNEIHHLKVPQRMRITYMGNSKNYRVEGVSDSGLITEDGLIWFQDITDFHASRYKNGGKKGLGVAVTLLGAFITSVGFAMLGDGWYTAGGVAATLVGGIAITAGGIALISSRRKYSTDSWKLESLPERKWGERIISKTQQP